MECITLRLKTAQKPYITLCLGQKALEYEALEPSGYASFKNHILRSPGWLYLDLQSALGLYPGYFGGPGEGFSFLKPRKQKGSFEHGLQNHLSVFVGSAQLLSKPWNARLDHSESCELPGLDAQCLFLCLMPSNLGTRTLTLPWKHVSRMTLGKPTIDHQYWDQHPCIWSRWTLLEYRKKEPAWAESFRGAQMKRLHHTPPVALRLFPGTQVTHHD